MSDIVDRLNDRTHHLCQPGMRAMPWSEVAVLFTQASEEIKRLRIMVDRYSGQNGVWQIRHRTPTHDHRE
jgi:hypothetical protein